MVDVYRTVRRHGRSGSVDVTGIVDAHQCLVNRLAIIDKLELFCFGIVAEWMLGIANCIYGTAHPLSVRAHCDFKQF